jgi:hypothetical protein
MKSEVPGWSDLPQAKVELPRKRLHRTVEVIRTSLTQSDRGEHGLRYTTVDSPMSVRVSRSQMSRALLFLDDFFRKAERHSFQFIAGDRGESRLVVEGERFRLELRERVRGRHDRTPSGRLALTVEAENYRYYEKPCWEDRSANAIESRVDEILVGIRKASDEIRRFRIESQQQKERDEARRRAEEEAARRQREETARRETLFKQATDWRRADDLRRFVAAAKDAAALAPSEDELQRLSAWAEWATAVADDIDPLSRR